jgi:hypothetical protein
VAVGAAVLWWPISRLARILFWELPGRAGVGVAVGVTAVALATATTGVVAILVVSRLRPVREIAVWAVAGIVMRAPGRAWPGPALATAATAAVATALLWWPIARVAQRVFWDLPGRAGVGVAVGVVAVAVAAAAAGLAAILVVPRLIRVRELAVWAVAGIVCGIAVPFLPIVVGAPLSADDFYRLIWFPSWI